MNPHVSRIALLISLFVASAITSFSQMTTGAIQGTVKDPAGEPIPSAAVTVSSRTDAGFTSRTLATDANGRFLFAELPPGTYLVRTEMKDFYDFAGDIEVFLGQTAIIDIQLRVSRVANALVVLKEPSERSTYTTNEIRDNKNLRDVSQLPVRPNIASALRFAPFSRPEPLAGGVQIDGATAGDGTYFIDGQEVTNFRTGIWTRNFDLPVELVQEVAVRSDAVAPQFSGSLGGSVSIVTRGGSDEYRGILEFSVQPSALSGGPNSILTQFGTTPGQFEYFAPRKDRGSVFFPSALVSGPVLKGRLWFSTGYAPRFYSTKRTIDYFSNPNPGTRTVLETISYRQTIREEQFFGRIDALAHKRLRANAAFFWNPVIEDGGLPSPIEGLGAAPQSNANLRGAEYIATRGGRQNSNMINGQAIFDATDRFQIGARAGRVFFNEKLGSYGIPKETRFICSLVAPVAGANCANGFQSARTNLVVDRDVSVRTTFDGFGSFIFNAAGRHYLKFGYGANRLFNDVKTGNMDTGVVQLFYGRSIDIVSGAPVTPTPGNLGSGFLQRTGTVGTGDSLGQALYIQDSVTIGNRLFITGGVRFEKDNFPDYIDGYGVDFGFGDKIAPRVAAMYDVFGTGETRIFGSFGYFYDRLKFAFSRNQFPQVGYRDFFEILPSRGAAYTNYTLRSILGGNADNPLGNCPITNSSGWSVCQISLTSPFGLGPAVYIPPTPIVDPNLKPARSSEISAGMEQHFPEFRGGYLVVSARYLRRRLDRGVEDVISFGAAGNQVYFLGNPGESLACEFQQQNSAPCVLAIRRYDAVEIQASHRTSGYFVNAAYTYSRLRGNYSGLTGSEEGGRLGPNVLNSFDSPASGFDADGKPADGALPTDRPHVFRAFGGYSFRWFGSNKNKTTVSAFTTIQSGTPLTTFYNLYGFSTAILNGRGDLGRTEMFSETDLRVGHVFRYREKLSFEPFVMVLNLFDERNELGRQTSISATNFTSTVLTAGGCTSCVSQIPVYRTIFSGGIRQFVQNVLTTRGVSATGSRNDYNQPNQFQSPRSVRFGLRFRF